MMGFSVTGDDGCPVLINLSEVSCFEERAQYSGTKVVFRSGYAISIKDRVEDIKKRLAGMGV